MTEEERNKLWQEYSHKRTTETREKIILEYAPLVKIVAGRLSMYLGYNVEYEDLVGYGIFGLIDAIDKFDYEKGIKFETYASLRIRGSILDQIRKMDWIPRSLRQKQKKIDMAVIKLETEHGRPTNDKEIAMELGISDDEFISWQGQANISNIISLDEFIEVGGERGFESVKNNTFETPEEVLEKSELKRMLEESLESLSDKEKKVILLYYYEEMTLKEISSILEVSESRISQLHTKALKRMKEKLGKDAGFLFKM
jgi:RNA polymerase sigma factor for flagellar operon FliA